MVFLVGITAGTAHAQFATKPGDSVGTAGGACSGSTITYGWPDTNGQILKCVSNLWTIVTQAVGAAGSTTQFQYNNSGVLGGTAGHTWDSTNQAMTLATIANPAASAFTITGGGLTGTTSYPALTVNQTWNNSGGTFTGIFENITNTASSSSSKLMDLQQNGISILTVGSGFGGSATVSGQISAGFNVQAGGASAFAWCCGRAALTSPATNTVHIGNADAASPSAQTFGVQNVVAGTTNTAGADFTINGSQGTGTAAGGRILFQVAPAGTASGSAQNALTTAMMIGTTGNVGIGTTTPMSPLHLSASYTGTGTQPTFIIENRSSGAGDQVNFNLFRGADTGTGINRGMGLFSATTSSGWADYENRSLVFYTGSGGSATSKLKINSASGTLESMIAESNSVFTGNTGVSAVAFAGYGGYWGIRSATNHSYNLDVYNAGTPLAAMTVLQSGAVGIGTTNPTSNLSIVGASVPGTDSVPLPLLVTSTGNGGFGVSSPGNSNYVLNILYQGAPTILNRRFSFGVVASSNQFANGTVTEDTVIRTYFGKLHFATASAGDGASNDAPRMTIQQNGNVGIGTTSPQSALSVNGGVAIGSAYAGVSAAPTDSLIMAGNVGIGTQTPLASLDLSRKTDAALLPVGTTGQQPTCNATLAGGIRYNSTTGYPEYCSGSAWIPFKVTGAPPGSGYFVLSSAGYNGNLGSNAHAGGNTGLAAANAICLWELTAHTTWWGYTTANADGILNSSHVFAFLCDGSTCNNATANKTYYFASVSDPTAGGASFTTDGSGLGPNDSKGWDKADHMGNTGLTWEARATTSNTAWANSSNANNCTGWTTNSSGTTGEWGAQGNTNASRWDVGAVGCNNVSALICMVNP